MVKKTTNSVTPRPVSYELKISRTGANGVLIERTISSSEINRLTPRGRPITASREEIVAVLRQSAKNTKRESSPIIEAAGAAKVRPVE